MAYSALAADMVHTKLDLGRHSLLVRRPQQTTSTPPLPTTSASPLQTTSTPPLQTPSTSPPPLQTTSTPPFADDQCGAAAFAAFAALAADQHIAKKRRQEPSPTAMSSSARFYNLMTYINCHGSFTQEAWCKQFGASSLADDFPWGTDFWDGFRSLMATQYLPHSALRHTCIDAYVPGWFTLPMNFAKSAAESPKTELNPASNNKYPCFILAYTYGHPYYDAVCIHQGLLLVKHWKVHASWLENLQGLRLV